MALVNYKYKDDFLKVFYLSLLSACNLIGIYNFFFFNISENKEYLAFYINIRVFSKLCMKINIF